jgi:hypothetical protein
VTDPYHYEERAAIMEYEGGLSRDEAERLAREDIENERLRGQQEELDL